MRNKEEYFAGTPQSADYSNMKKKQMTGMIYQPSDAPHQSNAVRKCLILKVADMLCHHIHSCGKGYQLLNSHTM